MSLVVAGYERGNLVIVSDTKLRYSYDLPGSLKNHVNAGVVEGGVIKLVVVNENICIGFAGDVDNAERAIREIQQDTSLDDVKRILLRYNQIAYRKTDFILCTNNDGQCIYQFKKGNFELVKQAWIGDIDAFERFQRSRIDEQKGISSALDEVINDGTIMTVGGFNVSVCNNHGKFTFGFYMNVSREAMAITLTKGKPFLINHGTAQKGSYTLNFIGSSADYNHVAFHIKQGNFGIIYSRNDNGLLRPRICKDIDEVDFHDYIRSEFRIVPSILTQIKFDKYFYNAMSLFNKKQFEKAIMLFDRAIKEGNTKEMCEALFFKGACFHMLRRNDAAEVFRQLVSIDTTFNKRVLSFLNSST